MPGTATFQATFSSPLQRVGTPLSWLVPSPRGPRQHGQFSARAGMDAKAIATHTSKNGRQTFIVRAFSG